MRLLFFVFLCVFLTSCSHSETAPEAATDVSGPPFGLWVWSAEKVDSNIDISIERTNGVWEASVQSKPVSIAAEGDAISLTDVNGPTFSGKLTADGGDIEGYWRQTSDDLGYANMVTRVVLPRIGNNRWEAEFSEQARPFNIFLDIFQNDASEVLAVIRNPERNEILRSTQFTVEDEGANNWALVSNRGGQEGRHRLKRNDDGGLQLDHNWFEASLSLKQATKADAATYYSRQTGPENERYKTPRKLADGWTVSSPEEAGFDRAALNNLISEISSSDPRDARPRMIHSMLVAHKGRLVFEEYFHGYDQTIAHDTRSLAKVFAPIMIGALRENGSQISANDQPVAEVLKRAGKPLGDARKADITLSDLMTYSSGLDCDTNSETSPGSEGRMWEQEAEKDFWLYTASLPLLHEPGKRYAYCSGSMNLVGATIEYATDTPIYETFHKLIAKPLEFGPYHWNLAPNDAAYLGGGVYMRPRDILKIGAVYTAGGMWNGRQIIDSDWITESITPKIDISPETTGLSPDEFGNSYFGGAQAYHWRADTIMANGETFKSYEATGNGGQILIIVPKLELSVVFTGGNYRMGGVWGRWRNELVGQHVIPAMK